MPQKLKVEVYEIMFENNIFHISQAEVAKIVQKIKKKPLTYLVEIDGIDIQLWNDYISSIEEKMKFPTTCIDSIDRYLDKGDSHG